MSDNCIWAGSICVSKRDLILCVPALIILFLAAISPQAWGQSDDLAELSLEELLDIEVTSVSKKAEKRSEAAAAIFVLTNDDIRRSGATSIPEALRLVPGVNVARLDGSKWSVTARGFGGRFGNLLLVLIDGRSIYTPLFAGVYWESNDVMLEDVDRIEIIRGPGGTLWGANATNGVINIVTKKAEETQGGLLTLGGGTEERAFAAYRYGGTLRDLGHYRIYGKFFARDKSRSPSGGQAEDDWVMGQGGFRLDLNISDRDSLTLQGDLFRNKTSQTWDLPSLLPPYSNRKQADSDFYGTNLLGRWTRQISEEQDFQLQFYYDFYRSDAITLDERRHTLDLDYQHRLEVGSWNELIWGAGFRITRDDIENSDLVALDPTQRDLLLFSAFFQDRMSFFDDRFRVTLGSKFEYNDFTGFEFQPTVRAAWIPNEKHTLWAAVSRAVHTPSRSEDDIHIVNQTFPFIALALEGDRDFDSVDLLAFELGYRVVVNERLAFDIATFYNQYENFRTIELRSIGFRLAPLPSHFVLSAVADNNGEAQTYGIEIVMDWQPLNWWRVRATYSHLEIDLELNVLFDPVTGAVEGDTPQNQFTLRNTFQLPHNLELDAIFRYVDELATINIDEYFALDIRLGWKPRENLELALVGQNLIESSHLEFTPSLVNTVPSQVQRGVYAKVSWEF